MSEIPVNPADVFKPRVMVIGYDLTEAIELFRDCGNDPCVQMLQEAIDDGLSGCLAVLRDGKLDVVERTLVDSVFIPPKKESKP